MEGIPTPIQGPIVPCAAAAAADEGNAEWCRIDSAWAVTLFVATIVVFARGLACDWVYYDDATFVLNNPDVNGGLTWRGFAGAFAIKGPSQYHPLTYLSHMLDYQVFGAAAWGHHLTSILLHAGSAAMVFIWLRLSFGSVVRRGVALLIAVLFAWHPLRVESVVWIAERKDVLCVLFALLTLLGQWWHARRPTPTRYLAMAGAFVLCVLSKPALAGLPVIMLGLDVWPLRRHAKAVGVGLSAPAWPRLIAEKVPLLVASVGGVVLSFLAQMNIGTVESVATSPISVRVANALVSVAWYLSKMSWPTGLAVFYPFRIDWPPWQIAVGGLSIVLISALAWAMRRRQPWLLLGWAWFITAVTPSIGLVQVGSQAMADRYSYFPALGVTLAVVLAVDVALSRSRWGRATTIAVGAIIAVLLVACTWRQIGFWRDGVALFSRAVAVTRPNSLSHHNLAAALVRAGREEEALPHYERTLQLKGDFALAHSNLGGLLVRRGQIERGLEHLRTAVRLEPDRQRWRAALANGHVAHAAALARAGQVDAVESALRRALETDPTSIDANMSLGMLLSRRDDLVGAAECYYVVLQADPSLAAAHNSLGVIRARQGHLDEAIACFQNALRANPKMEDARQNLARATAMRPQAPAASRPRS